MSVKTFHKATAGNSKALGRYSQVQSVGTKRGVAASYMQVTWLHGQEHSPNQPTYV